MKKISLFPLLPLIMIAIALPFSRFFGPIIFAFPGQCCSSPTDCDGPNETCTGTFSTPCGMAGYNNAKNTCEKALSTPVPTNPVPTPTPTIPGGLVCCDRGTRKCQSGMECSGFSPGCAFQNPNSATNRCMPLNWLSPTPPTSPIADQIFCNNDNGIKTALGCINISSSEGFIEWLLPKLIGMMGGIAFLIMIFGGIQIITSSGNPDKIKAGKDLIGSALTGLLFAIFSLFILRLIGVNILHIPGLD